MPSSNGSRPPDTGRSNTTRPAIREQIAHFPQDITHQVQRSVQDEPPSWMSRLEHSNNGSDRRIASDGFEAGTIPQLDFPVPEPLPRPNSPNSSQRELRVKVWQQEEPISSPGLLKQDSDSLLDSELDHLPTSPLIASSFHASAPRNATSAPNHIGQDSHVDELARMDTSHLVASTHIPSSQRVMQPSREDFDQSFALAQQPTSSLANSIVQTAAPHYYEPAFSRPAAAQSAQRNVPVAPAAQSQPFKQTLSYTSVITPQRKQRRKPLVLLVGLLLLVLLGGIGVWVGVAHPFSVPDVVQPQLSFSNSQLAFSVQYPTGWNERVDTRAARAYFADSTNTAQFTVAVAPANGKDAGQYGQQLANQLKMTSIKAQSPLSFGGTSWQQVQGNALFSGANYSETILVTVHTNQVYTITQAAPQTTYAQEEQIVFSMMRASFKFV